MNIVDMTKGNANSNLKVQKMASEEYVTQNNEIGFRETLEKMPIMSYQDLDKAAGLFNPSIMQQPKLSIYKGERPYPMNINDMNPCSDKFSSPARLIDE